MAGGPSEVETVYTGAEGMRVEVFDETRPYGYSNLFHVKLRVVARFPGEWDPYERVLERLGVPDSELARVRDEMLRNFEASALPYLLRPEFARKHSDHRSRERRKVIRFPSHP